MKRNVHAFLCALLCCSLLSCGLLCLAPTWTRAQGPGVQSYDRVSSVPRQEIDSWLKSEIVKSGGDLDNQRYSFIIGFSTGHFGQDPVHAIAMRRLAFSLLNNTLTAGDRVTSVAWEMNVWDKGTPITLTDDLDTRRQFVNSVPYAPEHASSGGHDVERALYDTLTEVVSPDEASSTIVLLLTNSNESQGPSGERAQLFGANNPKLAEEIKTLGFRTPPTRHSFGLLAKDRRLTVDVTALFPRKLVSLSGAPTGARYPTFARDSWQPAEDRPGPNEQLPNSVVQGTPPPSPSSHGPSTEAHHGQPWLWLLALVIILLICIVVYFVFFRPRVATIKVQAAKAAPVPEGKPIPGALEVVLGAKSSVLQSLTTASRFTLLRAGDALTVREEKPESVAAADGPPGAPVAEMSFDPKRQLCVAAAAGVQFLEMRGTNLDVSNSRSLVLAPGDRILCRVASADSPTPARLELVYRKEGKV